MATTASSKIKAIPLNQIDEPADVDRFEIFPEKTQELADSIREVGQLQPIVVRDLGGRYEIIAGHRRYLAHKLLKATTIEAIIKNIEESESALIRATENQLREGLSPLEEGYVYLRLVDKHGFTLKDLARRLPVGAGTIKRRIELTKMPKPLQTALHNQHISVGVAEELWRITDENALDYYLSYSVEHGITVAVARDWVKQWQDSVRRSKHGEGEIIREQSPFEEKPHYVNCDICPEPMKLGQETVIRACPACVKVIRIALEQAADRKEPDRPG